MSDSFEYYPNGDDEIGWKIGQWGKLSEAFGGMEVHELDAWHSCMTQENVSLPWLVVRRIYQVGPLYGEDFEHEVMESWDYKKLAAASKISEKSLMGALVAGVEWWRKQRNTLGLKRVLETTVVRDDGVGLDAQGLPEFQVQEEMDEEMVRRCLEAFRMDKKVSGKDDRLFAARRVLELKKFLDEKTTREQARQLIFMEISLGVYETAAMAMKSRMLSYEGKENLIKEQAEEVAKLMKDLKLAEEAQTSLSESHRKLAEALGEDDIEQAEQKRAALRTIGWWNEAAKEYHRDGTKKLVDGMFTASEVVWLTTGLSFRKPQYRPDIVIRAKDAMVPDHLWAADYKPNNVEREAARRLQKIVEGMADGDEPVPILGIDTGLSADEEDEDGNPATAPVATKDEDEPDRERMIVPVIEAASSAGVMAGGGY